MAKKRFLAILCIILTALFVFASCKPSNGGGGNNEEEAELADGYKRLTIYYHNDAGYDDKDAWMWYGSVDGRGYAFTTCEYGVKVVLDVPEDIEQVGFIIRTGCTSPGGTSWSSEGKDGTDSDRFVTLSETYTEIYLKGGDPNSYTSTDGGKTLELFRYLALADLTDLTHIKITVSDGSILDAADVSLVDGENDFVPMDFSKNIITTRSELDLSESYTLNVKGYDSIGVVPSTYFSSTDFENKYTYDGPLGVELGTNSTTFRLWAPTASKVALNIYDNGSLGKADDPILLNKKDKGLWEITVDENLNGKYYTYTVTTSMGTNEAVDPYAVSAGVNGQRGMILDLDSTDPTGWTNEPFVPTMAENGVANYTDAEIWEVHVRDFSNNISGSQYKGKFLAFTETGLKNSAGLPVGVDYLKELGITHVHLLPSFDYASVDEKSANQFNWGYDPQNYNVPEGSYSTDPANGAKRVNEFKQMVQALHNQGIGVIMDVVYNHTYSSTDSNFNKIVPYYYYRYDANGALSNGSGCGNETASERAMVRKFMVDSVTYWQNEYNVDGFRFDLMGLHDTKTMQQIETAVHATNPNALLYGEGWTGGTSTDTYSGALLANLQATNKGTSTKGVNGIAMFNDVIRDGVKGSVFDIKDTGFATGAKASYLPNVLFGVAGGINDTDFSAYYSGTWSADNPTQIVNYVSAHDNNTLWDRILSVYGEKDSLNFARNALSAAIVQTSLGIPFMQAGEEMLRSKVNEDGSYNENSYNASDAVNNLDWEALTTNSDQYKMMQYYKGLIAFRQSCETLRMASALDESGIKAKSVCEIVKKDGAFVAFTITNPTTGEKLLIIYNANENDVNYTLPTGNWNLYVNGTTAGATAIASNQSGAQTISKISCYVYKQA